MATDQQADDDEPHEEMTTMTIMTSKVARALFNDEAGDVLDIVDHDARDYAHLLEWFEVMNAEDEWEARKRFLAASGDEPEIDTTPGPLAASLDGKVACSVCNQWLRAGEIVQNLPVYKCGELNYIEIHHHVACTWMRRSA